MYEDYIKELVEAAIKDLKIDNFDSEKYRNSVFLTNPSDSDKNNIRIQNHIFNNLQSYYFSTEGVAENSEVWKAINKFHNSNPILNAEIYTSCEKAFKEACEKLNLSGYTFEEYLDYNSPANASKISQFQAINKYFEEQQEDDFDNLGFLLDLVPDELFKKYSDEGFYILYSSNTLFSSNIHIDFLTYSTRIKNLPRAYESKLGAEEDIKTDAHNQAESNSEKQSEFVPWPELELDQEKENISSDTSQQEVPLGEKTYSKEKNVFNQAESNSEKQPEFVPWPELELDQEKANIPSNTSQQEEPLGEQTYSEESIPEKTFEPRYEDYIDDLIEAACKDLGKESGPVKEYWHQNHTWSDQSIENYIEKNLGGYYFAANGANKNSEVWKTINNFQNSHPGINIKIYMSCKKVFEEACKRLNLTGYTFEEYLDYNPSENDLKTSQFQAIEKYIEDQLEEAQNRYDRRLQPSSDFATLNAYLFEHELFNQYRLKGLNVFSNFSNNGFRALSTRMKELPKEYEPTEEKFKLLIEAAIKDLGLENLDYEDYLRLRNFTETKNQIYNYVYYSINAYYLGNDESRQLFIDQNSNIYKAIEQNQLEDKEEIEDMYKDFSRIFDLMLKQSKIENYSYQQFLDDYPKNTIEVQKIKNLIEEHYQKLISPYGKESDSVVDVAIRELSNKKFFKTYSSFFQDLKIPSTSSHFLNLGYRFYRLKNPNIKKEDIDFSPKEAVIEKQEETSSYPQPQEVRVPKHARKTVEKQEETYYADYYDEKEDLTYSESKNKKKKTNNQRVQRKESLKKQLKSVLILANGISLGLGAWAVGANYLVYGGTLFNPATLAAFFTVPAATLAGTVASKVRKIFKNSKRRHEYKGRKEDFSENDFENEYSKEQEKENEEELSFEEQIQDDIFKDQGIEQLEQDEGYQEQDVEESEYDDGYEEKYLTQAHETLTATRKTINILNARIALSRKYVADYDTKLEEIEDRLFGSENLSKLETWKLYKEYKKHLEERNFWAKNIEKNENRIRSLNEDIQELSPERENYEDMDEFGYDDDSEYENEEEMGRSR